MVMTNTYHAQMAGRKGFLFIAASDATWQEKNQADFQCDGTDDQVQLEAADALANGKLIILSSGTFYLNDNMSLNSIFCGQGPTNTLLRIHPAYRITFTAPGNFTNLKIFQWYTDTMGGSATGANLVGSPVTMGAFRNTLVVSNNDNLTITLPAGAFGYAISGTSTVTGSPQILVAGANNVVVTGAGNLYIDVIIQGCVVLRANGSGYEYQHLMENVYLLGESAAGTGLTLYATADAIGLCTFGPIVHNGWMAGVVLHCDGAGWINANNFKSINGRSKYHVILNRASGEIAGNIFYGIQMQNITSYCGIDILGPGGGDLNRFNGVIAWDWLTNPALRIGLDSANTYARGYFANQVVDNSGQNTNDIVDSAGIRPGEVRRFAYNLDPAQLHANDYNIAWQNPFAQHVIVKEVMVHITTAGGTAGSVLDVGSASGSGVHGDDLINDGDLNATGYLVSTARVELDENGGATDWITGQILTADALNLVGKYYIEVVGV